jgi:phage baseplate assembly protein gpV
MTASNAPPSRNPSDNDTLNGMLRLVLTKFLQKTDDMLPAKVIEYDKAANTAQVQPLITVVTTDNQIVNRAQIASVPVFQLSMGGFILRFPCNSGDLGWIKANDRDISLFKQTGEMSPPNTQRKHSFEDALFLPQAAWSLITIDEEDAGNAVLQNYAGTVRIALWEDKVKITAPSVLFDTPTATFTGTINVLNTNSSETPCQIAGNINATGDIVAGSISLQNHVHTNGNDGADTGGPLG